jgi:hypothetical protein
MSLCIWGGGEWQVGKLGLSFHLYARRGFEPTIFWYWWYSKFLPPTGIQNPGVKLDDSTLGLTASWLTQELDLPRSSGMEWQLTDTRSNGWALCKHLGPFLTSPLGAKLSPRGVFFPRGQSYPLGVKFSVRPSILPNSRECSLLGVNEGVNIPPRVQISPLGARGEVKNGSQDKTWFVWKAFRPKWSFVKSIPVPPLHPYSIAHWTSPTLEDVAIKAGDLGGRTGQVLELWNSRTHLKLMNFRWCNIVCE